MKLPTSLDVKQHQWLQNGSAMTLLNMLNNHQADSTRFVGGCIRNALMGETVGDIDLATKLLPDEVMKIVGDAGHKTVPTGIDHGTITAVIGVSAFEVTTLRKDVQTDGRRAVTAFSQSWDEDSLRRDFRFNAIYCDAAGELYDPQGGIKDAIEREVVFIGNPDDRINEDFLRILRYFRFFAHYGSGRPDRAAITACSRLKSGIENLSAERIWKELQALLAAADPVKSVRWMRTSEVLQKCFPGSTDVDQLSQLIVSEEKMNWPIDPILRFMALLDPAKAREASKHLKLSNAQNSRVMAYVRNGPVVPGEDFMDVSRRLYRKVVSGYVDAAKLALGKYEGRERRDIDDMLDFAAEWERPVFPVTAKHLMDVGYKQGKELGDLLWSLEDEWISSGFALSMDELRAKIGNLGGGGKSGGQG
ncbi:MAG: CCA tRNA nucleotidyltransferase [Robiginitomaculum sp.]|nr:CCA tRNA nucleotidyltransferase [Robiginitomaculum sp.]